MDTIFYPQLQLQITPIFRFNMASNLATSHNLTRGFMTSCRKKNGAVSLAQTKRAQNRTHWGANYGQFAPEILPLTQKSKSVSDTSRKNWYKIPWRYHQQWPVMGKAHWQHNQEGKFHHGVSKKKHQICTIGSKRVHRITQNHYELLQNTPNHH